ncbi:MAG: ribokinase [Armatimonadota bacterium]
MNLTVTVVGSLNTDLVVKAPRLPEVGETVPGGTFATFPGGKGANQAVAAARLRARVVMVGRVGNDAFGQRLRQGLASEGIDVTHLRADPEAPSGVALITVDSVGRNTIVVASGANMRLTAADVEAARASIEQSHVLLLQLEVPLEAVERAASIAHAAGCRVILDPAPAPDRPLPDGLYRHLDVVNPNEVEARALSGTAITDAATARAAAEHLLARGCRAVVIKLGDRGAYVAVGVGHVAGDGPDRVLSPVRLAIPGISVEAVDTTAAGDAFAAALAVAIAEGKDLLAAARFANAAGALSVTRMGAQPSMPSREDVAAFAASRQIVL